MRCSVWIRFKCIVFDSGSYLKRMIESSTLEGRMVMTVKQGYEIIKWIMDDEMLNLEQKLRFTKDIKRDLRRGIGKEVLCLWNPS